MTRLLSLCKERKFEREVSVKLHPGVKWKLSWITGRLLNSAPYADEQREFQIPFLEFRVSIKERIILLPWLIERN